MIKNERGDTIIEVLFAMTIIGVILAAAYAVASRNLQVSQLAKERTQATEIAVSQLDQLKALQSEPATPASGSFCLDLTSSEYVIDSADEKCRADGYRRVITKTDNQYKVAVEWVPPGGDESNLASVEFYYSDYNFATAGASGIVAYTVSSTGAAAVVGVNILDTAGVLEKGLVYGSVTTPRVNDSVSTVVRDTSGGSQFQVNLNGLNAANTYYARGFARTADGYIYSNVVVINRSGASEISATVTTLAATNTTFTRSTVRGEIVADNGSPIVEKGFAFGTMSNPSVTNNKVVHTNTTEIGSTYSAELTGLQPGVTYYVRAYASNGAGVTAYGPSISFTTTAPPSGLQYQASFEGSSYFLSSSTATLTQARAAATASGGHLVTIGSAAENAVVAAMAGGRGIWMGANDLAQEGRWVWEDTGVEFFIKGTGAVNGAYVNWDTALDEPNDYPGSFNGQPVGEDGAVMNWGDTSSGRWNDWHEYQLAFYVIEYD